MKSLESQQSAGQYRQVYKNLSLILKSVQIIMWKQAPGRTKESEPRSIASRNLKWSVVNIFSESHRRVIMCSYDTIAGMSTQRLSG